MNSPTPRQALAALPSMAEIPAAELDWLVQHGEVIAFKDGDRFGRQYAAMTGVLVLLSGRFSVRIDTEGVEREIREVRVGGISGYLPYSRATVPRAFLLADGPGSFLVVPIELFPDLTRACYHFTAACVHAMLDRVRDFKADDKQQEKLASLGRLAGGLAHELNNPTAAISRAARELEAAQDALATAARALGQAGLPDSARELSEALEALVLLPPATTRTPLQQSAHEDQLVEWLVDHAIDEDAAYPLAATRLAVADLHPVDVAMDANQVRGLVTYLAARAAMRQLGSQLSNAAERVHSLVSAVKAHTHMDRATTSDAILLGGHLGDTVTLMSARAGRKGVSIGLEVAPNLPAVAGTVAELNQVWMNLVDNAVDAAPEGSTVTIEAHPDADCVRVAVIDDGPGIPAEACDLIFEPFYTTKEVGYGRGLGLDVVRTVVHGHRGSVTLDSRPGRTVFEVRLPVAGR